MAGINKVIIVGRLGSDPEVKTLSSGQSVARFNVATSESWTGKDGQKQERTEWHRVVVWNKLAELCGKYLTKGRQVYAEGRLQTNSWEDQQGQKRYTTEVNANIIEFLGGRGDQQSQPSYAGATAGVTAEATVGANTTTADTQDFGAEPSFDSTEEMPF